MNFRGHQHEIISSHNEETFLKYTLFVDSQHETDS